jgi:hypothetical protein
MILIREMTAFWKLLAGLGRSTSEPSVPQAQGLLLGFDVNIAGTRAERLDQNHVDHADDRRALGALHHLLEADLVLFLVAYLHFALVLAHDIVEFEATAVFSRRHGLG